MTIHDTPPFGLGQTLAGKDSEGNLINKRWLGAICEFVAPNTASDLRGQKSPPTGKTIKAICLRNESGLTLAGKRVALLTNTAGYSPIESVDGYANVAGVKGCVIVDSYLPSTGVADDDIFWGILEGPCLVSTASAADATNVFAVGSNVVAAVAATTGAATAGRVGVIALANATDATGAAAIAEGRLGKALSARTTGNTNVDLLMNANIRL